MVLRRVKNRGSLAAALWLAAAPLLQAETAVQLDASVRAVGQSKDAVHPERAFVSRQSLSEDEASATMPFELSLKMRNFADLQARLAKGERISAAEMATKYEPSAASYQRVTNWLSAHGFTITLQDPHHVMIFAQGPVSRIQQAMNVTFAKVAADHAEYTSAISAPQLPASLSPLVVGVNGLQPHIRPHSHLVMAPAGLKKMSIGGPAAYTPAQIAQAYQATGLYNSGINGAGQTIAIIIDAFPNTSDLTTFWNGCGINQSLNNVQFIQAASGTMPSPSGEETLDVEWSSAMAPGAKVRVYGCTDLSWTNLDQGYLKLYQDVTTHPEYNIHQMSMSYGLGELYASESQVMSDDQIFAELAAAGVTIFASSGDGGSTPLSYTNSGGGSQVMVSFPADDPNITAVGGTSLNAPNGVEQDEEVWNDNNGYAGGGGISVYFSRPAWQTAGSGTMRQVPDIAGSADINHGAQVYLNGSWWYYGGTSWSSPTSAGFMGLINEARAHAGQGAVGPLNPQIYSLLGTSCFRDITVGNNVCPGSNTTLYSASVGYDLCTGLGSMQVQTLANRLCLLPQIAVNPTTLTLPSVEINTASTGSFTISNPGTAALTISSINFPSGMQGNWASGTIAAGGSQVVHVTYTSAAAGTFSGAIQISSSVSTSPLGLPFTIVVTPPPPPQITLNPTSLALPVVPINTATTGSFTISDFGTVPLTVASITFPTGMQGDWTSGTIAAGGSQVVHVTYTPAVVGTVSGKIQISNNATNAAVSLPFSVNVMPPPVRPQVLTNPATSVTGNSAVLNSMVNPNESADTAYFQYGTTTAYGATTAPTNVANGSNAPFVQPITGLNGNTTYHYRVVATNSLYTVYGSDMTFLTMPQPTFGALTLTGNDGAGARISGLVTPNGVATTVYIQYGTTPAYGSETSGVNLTTKAGATTITGLLSGLQPGTTYYYRLVTVSASGTYDGPAQTFTSAPFTVSTVYTTGSSVPDIAGAEFSSFSNPAINDQDHLAFKATMITGIGGITTANATGLWAADSTGTTHLVAQEGAAAPGTAMTLGSGTVTANFATFSDPVYNNNGQVAFSATLAAGAAVAAGTTTGVWSNCSGTLSLVARLGAQAPGCAAHVTFNSFEGVSLPDQGGVLLLATVGSGKTASTGLWEGTSAQDLQLLAQTGQSLNGRTVTGLAILPNSAVQTRSFTQLGANLACVETFSDKSTAILTLVGDDWTVAAQTADAAPGFTNGTYASFGNPVINGQNHTAFAAKLSTGTAGVWADDSTGTRNLLAAAGAPAPGTSSEFTSFSDPVDNCNDTVAFVANLTNGASGIWAGAQPELVAETGSQAPGCATGIEFSAFNQMALPDQGGVVFLGKVKGTGVTSQNSTGIWAVNTSNALELIMRAGDSFGGKTVASFSFLPAETVVGSQTRSFIQDSGDLTYLVTNTDGSTSLLKVVFP